MLGKLAVDFIPTFPTKSVSPTGVLKERQRTGSQRGVFMSNPSLIRITSLLFAFVAGAACVSADDWPGWRGPKGDNHVTGFTAPATWPKDLKKGWNATVGCGESSPILLGDKIFTFGREGITKKPGADEIIRCLDAATGKE